MNPFQPQPAGLPSGTIGGRRSRSSTGWQWRRLMATPQRLVLAAAAAMLLQCLAWWLLAELAPLASMTLPWVLPAEHAQALVLGLALPPLLAAGLMLGQAPQWLGLPALRPRTLLTPMAMMLIGWSMALTGFHLSVALAALGLAVAAGGLALLAGRLAVMLIESRSPDKDHARLILIASSVGALALWLTAVAVGLRAERLALAALQASLWGSSGLLLLSLTHRLLPDFTNVRLPSQAAWRPRVLLAVLAVLIAVQAPFAAARALGGPAMAVWPGLLWAASQVAAALVLFWLAVRWGLRYSLQPSARAVNHQAQPIWAGRGSLRLLAMLHLGFAWLGVAFGLGAVSTLTELASQGQRSLGAAPQLAFMLGFVGSTLLALASQAALKHTGRALLADRWTWAACWTLQVAAALAVMAALLPGEPAPLRWLALQFGLVAGLTWVARQGRWLGRPRLDGQLG